ncbi:MAG: glycerophosphodiester phosphodiesterase family protein [Sphingomicrobium sp.]
MRSSPSKLDPLDPGPAGFAHRGLHGVGVPENSLAAFQAALDREAGIECDVRLSGDGSAVVFHDGNLKRICDVALDVERTASALLTGQRLGGTNEYLPALWRVLELVDGQVPLLLELKTRKGNAAKLCAEVRADLSPRSGAIGIMSFDPKVLRWFRRNAPHIRRGFVIGEDLSWMKRWLILVITAPQFIAVNRAALGLPWVVRARRRMPIYSWTIRTPTEREQASVHADVLIWEADGRP